MTESEAIEVIKEYRRSFPEFRDSAEFINLAINDLEEKMNNDWIQVSERLPEEHYSIFAKLKGTDKWDDSMFEKTSDEVNVTVIDGNGNRITTHAHTIDRKWKCDLLRINRSYRIIAWKPYPQPFNENRN